MPNRIDNPIKNGIGFRAEWQAHGLGLNAANSWVIKTLDGDEFEHLKTVNFQAIRWQDEEHVLVVRGTERCGLSVRFVNLSNDGRYCRFPRDFPITYLSPQLLRAEPMTKRDFVASIAITRRSVSTSTGRAKSPVCLWDGETRNTNLW